MPGPTRRFAFVTPNFHPRTCGVGDFSMRLAQELQRRGMPVKIFSRAPAQPHPQGAEIPVAGAEGKTPMLIAARLRREIDEFAPTDLVLQYTPQMLGASRFGSAATLMLAAEARRAGRNVVVVAHELFLPWARRPDLAAGAALMRAQLVALLKLCTRFIVTMDTRVAELAPFARLAGAEDRIGVVRIGTAALPRPRELAPGRFRLGVFSTLASTKRFDIVLEAFEKVHARHPTAELVLLGDLGKPDDPRLRALMDIVQKHPGRDRIRVPGKLDLADVSREVAALDVYLFPMISGANTRTSTLPLAFGTGVPVVATRSYETDELFVGDENVVFADELTGEAFGRAALRIADDPALAERVAAGGRTLYKDHLTWARIGEQFLEQIGAGAVAEVEAAATPRFHTQRPGRTNVPLPVPASADHSAFVARVYAAAKERSKDVGSTNPYALLPDTLAFLELLVEETSARQVIEFGSGESTYRFARALAPRGGKLVSVEHDLGWAGEVEKRLEGAARDAVRLVRAPLRPTMHGLRMFLSYAGLEGLGADIAASQLVLLDGPHQSGREAVLYLILSRCTPGTIVVADDFRLYAIRDMFLELPKSLAECFVGEAIDENSHGLYVLRCVRQPAPAAIPMVSARAVAQSYWRCLRDYRQYGTGG
jgi:glycosyltransferase involved in cell wall biosynthesis/predicted O-methyltransferase YrrM